MGINILTEEHLEKIKKDEHDKGYNKGYAKAKLVGEQNLQAYIDKKKQESDQPTVTLDQSFTQSPYRPTQYIYACAPVGKPKDEAVPIKQDTLKVYYGLDPKIKTDKHVFFIPGRNPIIQYAAYSDKTGFNQLRTRIYEAYKNDVFTNLASINLNITYEDWLNSGKPIITATVSYLPKDEL